MLFNSTVFALFLPAVLIGYYSLKHRWQNLFLLAASYVFYGWWDWRFLSLLLVSTVIDYYVALALGRSTRATVRKSLLLLSIGANLGILCAFKYFNFFVGSAAAMLNAAGLEANVPLLSIVLPVGISFYTFQTMSYTIDVYRGDLTPMRHLTTFALYVSYFPQLVAGPIERATRLLPQLAEERMVTSEQIRSGLLLIVIGLFRKVGIADSLAPFVDQAFEDPQSQTAPMLVAGLYLFALQIYCDFAGYTDIARGCSRLMGIELMENFRQPYFARSLSEFWQRWHISLSSWLRDYLYIPLGGNRSGRLRTHRNLLITMLLGGLWHGAAWTFVVWGALHGTYLILQRMMPWGNLRGERPCGPRACISAALSIALTFHLVLLTWLFFRAPSMSAAGSYLAGLGRVDVEPAIWTIALFPVVVFWLPVLVLDGLQYRTRDQTFLLSWRAPARGMACGAMMIWIVAFGGMTTDAPFIYFQF